MGKLEEIPVWQLTKVRQGTGEEKIVAKSKSTLNLVSNSEASSSTVLSPKASNLRAPSQKGSFHQESTGNP